ncbi:MAG: TRAP transporter small permease [Spirochaetes bacterium]|nr:TRAP transporter small permease [Spirochaetota bacterium]
MKFIIILNDTFDKLARVLFFFIIGFVFFAALARWFGFPVAWSMDLAQVLFGWVIFLGADHTLRENGHIGIDYVINKFPDKYKRMIMIINYLMILAFLAVIAGYGVYLCILNAERRFDILQISYSFATASVPAGCFLMFITVIRKLVSLFKGEDLNKKLSHYVSPEGDDKCY